MGECELTKKLLTGLLSLAVVISMCFAVTVVAFADENGTGNGSQVEEPKNADPDTLSAQIVSAGNECVITMQEDLEEEVIVEAGKKVTIDLNGHSLKNRNAGQIVIDNAGTLILKSSKEGGLIESIDGANYTIQNTGNLTIEEGVTVKSVADTANGSMIHNGKGEGGNAKLTINGGTFEDNTLNSVKNEADGTAVINGGSFKNTKQHVILTSGAMTIEGGTFQETAGTYAIENFADPDGGFAGNLTINDANVIVKSKGTAVRSNGTTKINKISVQGSRNIVSKDNGDVFPTDVFYLNDGDNIKVQSDAPAAGEYKLYLVRKDGQKVYYKHVADCALNTTFSAGTTAYLWESLVGEKSMGFTLWGKRMLQP